MKPSPLSSVPAYEAPERLEGLGRWRWKTPISGASLRSEVRSYGDRAFQPAEMPETAGRDCEGAGTPKAKQGRPTPGRSRFRTLAGSFGPPQPHAPRLGPLLPKLRPRSPEASRQCPSLRPALPESSARPDPLLPAASVLRVSAKNSTKQVPATRARYRGTEGPHEMSHLARAGSL